MTTDLPIEFQLADVLVHQSRLNVDVADVLSRMREAGELETSLDELREDVAGLAHEQSLQATRMESLTATVGQLMQRLDPLPAAPELHSVKAQPAEWYPALCESCGHHWDAEHTAVACPSCGGSAMDVSFGPLTRYAE